MNLRRQFAAAVIVIGTVLASVQAGKQTVMLPMSDGSKLATDVYLPEGKGPWPVILTRTPYNRNGAAITAAVAGVGGYAFVAQDMRGRFASEGENLPFIGCGWGEHKDGAETVAWILKQDWCNGKLGTVGGSAGGITQNLLAGAVSKGIASQHITVAAASLYHDAAYNGGALRKCQVEGWLTQNKFDKKVFEIWRGHLCLDDYWEQFDTNTKVEQMTAPAMHVGGWFDTFCQGTIDSFVARQHKGGEGARGRQKLVMGPWTHGVGSGRVGQLSFPNAGIPRRYDMTKWFECTLKGINNGIMDEPPVAYYVMGDAGDPNAPGNQWRFAKDWPIPAEATAFYFHKDGALTTAAPSGEPDEYVEFTFDPADPCPTVGGRNLNIARGPMDQGKVEARKDVLNFTTDVLTEPIEVTGRLTAKVFVSSSAQDTDLSVRFCDVYPDGKSYLIADGIGRLRFRQGFRKPVALVPGEVCEVGVDLWSTSIVVNKGHRIRVTVTSSNYPRFDLNPGTGEVWTDGCKFVKQTNRVCCDATRPSHIILPVVKASPNPPPR